MATAQRRRAAPTDDLFAQEASRDVVRKAVDALAVVPTKQRIYPLARKLYNVLIFLAQRQGFEQDIFRAPLRELVTTAAFTSNDTEIIKNHLRQMNATQVEWQSPTKAEGSRWEVSNLIAHAALIDAGRAGRSVIVEWSFPPNIKRELLDPQRFAQISLLFQSHLRSNAALSLFEICTRYIDNPGALTARNAWEWWRPVLTGIPDRELEAYREYKYFKRDVLKPAVAEINKVTDLEVELVEHKIGRRIDELQFRVRRKAVEPPRIERQPSNDIALIGLAIEAGVNQAAAERLIVQYGDSRFKAALNAMRDRIKSGRGKIDRPEQYLNAMLRKGDFEVVPVRVASDATADDAPRPSRQELEVRYRDSRRQTARELFAEFDESDRQRWLRRYESESLPNAGPLVRGAYAKSALQTRAAQVMFYEWFAEETWGTSWNKPTAEDLVVLVTQG